MGLSKELSRKRGLFIWSLYSYGYKITEISYLLNVSSDFVRNILDKKSKIVIDNSHEKELSSNDKDKLDFTLYTQLFAYIQNKYSLSFDEVIQLCGRPHLKGLSFSPTSSPEKTENIESSTGEVYVTKVMSSESPESNDLLDSNDKLAKSNTKLKNENQGLLATKHNLTEENKDLFKANTTLKSQNENLTNENEKLTSINTNLKSQNENLTNENEKLTNTNTNLKSQNERLADENTNLTDEKSKLIELNKNLKGKNAELVNTNTTLTNEITALKSENAELSKTKITLTEGNKILSDTNSTLKKENDVLVDANKTLIKENGKLEFLLEQLTEKDNVIAGLNSQILSLNNTINNLTDKNANLLNMQNSLFNEKVDLEYRLLYSEPHLSEEQKENILKFYKGNGNQLSGEDLIEFNQIHNYTKENGLWICDSTFRFVCKQADIYVYREEKKKRGRPRKK